jgi:hypothetical protein
VIDFRYHVVSIIAVFLALALGLFVGSTSLQDAVVHSLKSNTDRVAHENTSLGSQLNQAQERIKADEAFDRALLPYAVSGRLSGQLVSVVSAPGVSDSVRKAVFTAMDAAGATVTADVRLQPALLDPTQTSFVAALADRVKVPERPATAAGGDARTQAAAQIAAVLGVRPSARGVGASTVDTVLGAYSTAKLLNVVAPSSATTRPGTLAVVLVPPPPAATTDDAVVENERTFLAALAQDLDDEAIGAVLAGPTAAAGAGSDYLSAISAVHGFTDKVSTVTGVETSAGQMATVYALAGQADGVSGRFGLGTGVTPLPTPSGAP